MTHKNPLTEEGNGQGDDNRSYQLIQSVIGGLIETLLGE